MSHPLVLSTLFGASLCLALCAGDARAQTTPAPAAAQAAPAPPVIVPAPPKKAPSIAPKPMQVEAAPAAAGGQAEALPAPPVKRPPPRVLKLAPSAQEIAEEHQLNTQARRQATPKDPDAADPTAYPAQSTKVSLPTQVPRVPGPGSRLGRTAAERKATIIDHTGPSQNTTFPRN